MSSLLEQAIIDATALKEAATKNAEKNLIDKYSDKIKEAVDKLLEQDMQNIDMGSSGDEGMDAASSLENVPDDLEQDSEMGQAQPEEKQPKDPLEKIKSSFMMNGNDDELISIDFSSLKTKPVSPMGAEPMPMGATAPMPPAAPAPVAAPVTPPAPEAAAPAAPMQEGLRQYEFGEEEMIQEEDEESEDAELEINVGEPDDEDLVDSDIEEEVDVELSEEEMCEGGDCGDMGMGDDSVVVQLGEDNTYAGGEYVENLEESDEELEEELDLEESLIVDMEGVSDGWRGAQPNERRELENVELARLQDEQYQLKIKEYEEAVESAQKKVKKASKEKEVLMRENKELKSTLLSLKEHIEKMNLSNAKLLYMNRALGNPSLNERQKEQVVETISRTESIEGAKVAFETLQSSVQSVRKEAKAPKSLNEAVSRSSSPFLVRPRTQEANPYTERMKLLAGINKTN